MVYITNFEKKLSLDYAALMFQKPEKFWKKVPKSDKTSAFISEKGDQGAISFCIFKG